MRGRRAITRAACLLLVMLLAACASSAPVSSKPRAPQPPTSVRIPAGPITYVALGASDAVGVGSNEPGSQGYVPLIGDKLPRGSHVINLGLSGIRLHEALTQELPIALTLSPNLITIWLVANDFIGGVSYTSYMHDLNTLLDTLHTRTHAAIVMANLPDLTRLPVFANMSAAQQAQTRQEIVRWNAGIASLATRYGVALVDLYSQGSALTAHPQYISADGFHPSPAGYVQLAKLFWAAIKN
jgi:acyl-CoA thioesterase-1